MGWHLAVKCAATLVPRLRRHHASRVSPLAPRVAEAHLLAEHHLLADGHLRGRRRRWWGRRRRRRRSSRRRRKWMTGRSRSLVGSTLHPPLRCPLHPPLRCLVVFLLDTRNKKLRLLLVLYRLLHRRLLLDPTVPPRDANARLREVARARGPQGRQVASNLLQVEHASGILGPHTWTHAPNGLDKGWHRKGAPS